MKRSRKQWINDTWLLALTSLVLSMYFVLDVPHAVVHMMNLPIDAQIPRFPIFAIPYLMYLPWLWGTLAYAWYKNLSFKQLAISYMVVDLVAFTCYLTYQTYIQRPPLIVHDFQSSVLQFIYSHDLPYSAFPSLHSAMSAVIATYFVCRRSKYAWAAVGMAALIVVSTLFTKQHVIVDAISGVTLGVVATWIVFRFLPSKEKIKPVVTVSEEA